LEITMELSPQEAQQALDAIQQMVKRTQRAIASSGAYNFLIIWGFIWLLGFTSSQFLPGKTVGYVWMALDLLGAVASVLAGIQLKNKIRSSSAAVSGRRIAYFWLLLFIYCGIFYFVASPSDSRQGAMIIILFVMIGWIAMGLLLSVSSIGWSLGITALALIGYYLLPGIFYLWMAVLGGGGMIALGFYIRKRW
jgi:hypothetical protein